MRRTLILLTPLLLAGCVDGSASYYVNGSREHALTLRAEQQYFWNDAVTLKLIAARLPDCQRQYLLGKVPEADLKIEVYANGDNLFTMRAGAQAWQVETQTCSQLTKPVQGAPGERLGTFRLNADKKLVFEK
jgi:hypothetical protein